MKKNETLSISDFRHLYLNADYSKFNSTYQSKYNAYIEFLKKHGIVSQINEKNSFFSQADERRDFETSTVNCEKFEEMEHWFKPRMPIVYAGCAFLAIKNWKKEYKRNKL